ncbi:uncharacterized protein LOC129768239 [Toxorhynchites rutilus septentrionalis]|uniref:uncharacterized protein LOC129768239 n=1 Tax=Toxorhynchites rutilus septentrionalis TaxID=329112 RepID=UPI002479A1BB|nr:uncharacterized protein LOC129768239 [Toxorhynchites rutilus septentrionalis]
MDIFIPIAICFILFIFFSLCGMCCKRRRDQGAIIATPVVITSTQHHVGGYPVTQASAGAVTTHGTGVVMQQHTTGTGVYPIAQPMPGYNPAPTADYPRQTYPTQQQQQYQMPMPMPAPMSGPMQMPMPSHANAPPAPNTAAHAAMNPPSYDQVVNTSEYAKQSPYNPNFTG